MGHLGIARLPVVDDRRRLVGIVTASDVIRLMGRELSEVGGIGAQRIEAEQEATPGRGPCHWPPRR
jgi:CBS domain-containing protein